MLAQFINICAIVISNDYCSDKDMAFKIIVLLAIGVIFLRGYINKPKHKELL
jgi:hypothetical protein